MAIKPRLLPEDQRWLEIISEYQGDPVRFGMEVCGYELSRHQRRLLRSVARSGARSSVASGHGTGKTKSISIIVLWHLLCHPLATMLVTANDVDQLKATLWKEVGATLESLRQGHFGWLAEHVFLGADCHCHIIGYKEQWFCESKTANDKTANKMAGRHGEWYMVIADEGSTIPDSVFETLSGGLTGDHNRILITSQYTRISGYFHKTQTELSKGQGGEWDAMRFSSFNSPWVSDKWIKEKLAEYEDDQIRVRIRGLPPEENSGFFMNLRHAQAMYSRGRIIGDDEPYGWVIASDNALGEGLRDKSSVVVARVIGDGRARRVEVVEIPLFNNKTRANQLAGNILAAGMGLSNPGYVVDKGGVGSVFQDIEDSGAEVTPVTWGNPCWRNENREAYLNQRAQATHHAARAAKEGRLSFLTTEFKKYVLAQASGIPIAHTGNFRIKVPEKGSSAWEGRPSPDLWDAVCFFFLENVEYRVANDGAMTESSAVSKARESALSVFADLLGEAEVDDVVELPGASVKKAPTTEKEQLKRRIDNAGRLGVENAQIRDDYEPVGALMLHELCASGEYVQWKVRRFGEKDYVWRVFKKDVEPHPDYIKGDE